MKPLAEIRSELVNKFITDAWQLEKAQKKEAIAEVKKIRFNYKARSHVEFLKEYFGITEKDLEG